MPIFLYMLNCFPGIAKNGCYSNLWPAALIALGNKTYKLCTIGITIYVYGDSYNFPTSINCYVVVRHEGSVYYIVGI